MIYYIKYLTLVFNNVIILIHWYIGTIALPGDSLLYAYCVYIVLYPLTTTWHL